MVLRCYALVITILALAPLAYRLQHKEAALSCMGEELAPAPHGPERPRAQKTMLQSLAGERRHEPFETLPLVRLIARSSSTPLPADTACRMAIRHADDSIQMSIGWIEESSGPLPGEQLERLRQFFLEEFVDRAETGRTKPGFQERLGAIIGETAAERYVTPPDEDLNLYNDDLEAQGRYLSRELKLPREDAKKLMQALFDYHQDALSEAAFVSRELGLSAAQSELVKNVYLKIVRDTRAASDIDGPSPYSRSGQEAETAALQAELLKARLKPILTEEQYQRFEEHCRRAEKDVNLELLLR